MTYFHMCKLWIELQLVTLFHGISSFECSQILLQDNANYSFCSVILPVGENIRM